MEKTIIIVLFSIVVIALILAGLAMWYVRKQSNNEDPLFWEKDIKKIEERDAGHGDVDIVFVGSSSIRKWVTLAEDFSEYSVVNNGFGGSKVADTTYYFDRLVTAYNPKAIVVFTGTNDIYGSTSTSKNGEEVFELVKELYEKSQEELPGVPVYYTSISPTIARWKVWEEAEKANQQIKEYAQTQEYLTFIDTTNELMVDGEPNTELFENDGLHLNAEEYKLWASIIKPVVTQGLD